MSHSSPGTAAQHPSPMATGHSFTIDRPIPYTVTEAGAHAVDLPAIKAGFRLVPALIGTRRVNHIAYIECPVWCTEDHTDYPYTLDDIAHQGDDDAEARVRSFAIDPSVATFAWSARLYSDPSATDPRMRAVHVMLTDETGLDAHATPEMTDQLADEMVAFAGQLRHRAQAARLHNRAADDDSRGSAVHDQADEALRRVRGGAA